MTTLGLQVNVLGTGLEWPPIWTSLSNGSQVAVWLALLPSSGEIGLHYQLYSQGGAALGQAQTVPVLNDAFVGMPSVIADASGGWVLQWHETAANGAIAYQQQFDGFGNSVSPAIELPSTAPFAVNAFNAGAAGVGTDDDDIEVLSQASHYQGLGGNDFITGSNGNDIIIAGSGVDHVEAGDGDDLIKLGVANSQLVGVWEYADGGSGNDTMFGSEVADRLDGNGGADDISGFAGDDSISGGNKADILRGGSGRDKMYGGKHDDVMRGGRDEDTVRGEAGNDLLFGNQDDDVLVGDMGRDTLWGGEEDDYLLGGAGRDRLIGENGDDTLSGGSHVDAFWFTKPIWGNDVLLDFEDGFEVLRMKGSGISGFNDLVVSDVDADALIEFGESSILIIAGAGLIGADDFIF